MFQRKMTVTEGEASGTPEPLAWRLSYEGSQGPGRGPQHLGYRWLSRKLTAGPSSKVLPRPTRDSACRSRVCACWAGSLGTSSLMEQGSGGIQRRFWPKWRAEGGPSLQWTRLTMGFSPQDREPWNFPVPLLHPIPGAAANTGHKVTAGTRNIATKCKRRRVRKTCPPCVGGNTSLRKFWLSREQGIKKNKTSTEPFIILFHKPRTYS